MASVNHPLTEVWIGDTDPAAGLGDVLYIHDTTGTMKVRGNGNASLITVHDPAAQVASEKGQANGYASLDGNTLVVEAAQKIRELSGPTTLTAGGVADGQYFKRSGTTYTGSDPRLEKARLDANIRVVTTTPYSVAATDFTILGDTATVGSDTTINLPAATGSGRILVIKKWTAGLNVIIHPNGGTDTIDGSATDITLATLYATRMIQDAASGAWAVLSTI